MNFPPFIQKYGVVILVLLALVAGYLVGHRPVKPLQSQLEINTHLRDSLQAVADTLFKKLDLAYAENSKKQTKEKIRYVTKIKEVQIANYYAMDTSGRVNYFHGWVVDSTNRYIAERRN